MSFKNIYVLLFYAGILVYLIVYQILKLWNFIKHLLAYLMLQIPY